LTVVWTTLATLFLLMPGFAFIAGVNVTDKNVREIVFRGTPAELAYVVAISLIVHTAFLALPIGPRTLIDHYVNWSATTSDKTAPPQWSLSILVFRALVYTMVAAFSGGGLGFVLGKVVAKWRWSIFIKHRWMTELLGADKGNIVYARALTMPKFETGEEQGDHAVFVEGYIRDCFFAADGTLLYLAFSSSQIRLVKLSDAALAAVSGTAGAPSEAPGKSTGRLLLEGRNVLMAQYERVLAANVSSPSDLEKLNQAADEDNGNGGGLFAP
jgi:hypothetical protein